MDEPETCWVLLGEAAEGQDTACNRFSDLYAPMVRATLRARWRGGVLVSEVDDATQEVFVECLKEGGALRRAADAEAQSFRAFLFGVVRNVARRFEERAQRRRDAPVTRHVLEANAGADDETLANIFDRQWVMALVERARERMAERAKHAGTDAVRRVELLHLRFVEDLPIRTIAKRWNVDPTRLHRDYARARQEFERALREVILYHHPDAPHAVERELREVFAEL